MKRKQELKQALSVVYPDSAWIDVGSREHFVCVPADRDAQPIRPFAAFTEDLFALGKWCSSPTASGRWRWKRPGSTRSR